VDHKRVLAGSLLALEEAENSARASVQLGPRPIDPVIEERGRLRLLKRTAKVDVKRSKPMPPNEQQLPKQLFTAIRLQL
jgi:hypothetical protein